MSGAGKGDTYRKVDIKKFGENWDGILWVNKPDPTIRRDHKYLNQQKPHEQDKK